MSQGITYVVWGNNTLKPGATFTPITEAIMSAKSHQYPTCIITDDTSTVPNNVFSIVIKDDFSRFEGYNNFYRKFIAFERSPFDSTILLDSDTRVIGPLDLVFRKIEQFGLVMAMAPGQTFLWYDIQYVHYNSGLIGYKGNQSDLLNKLLETSKEFGNTQSDEAAISVMVDRANINPFTLPEVFNYFHGSGVHPRKIHVWHSHEDVKYTHTENQNVR